MNRGIYINDDFCGFWHAGPEKMNEAGLREQIDFYTDGGGVEAILFNMNAQRAYYDSKVYDPVWKDVEFRDDGSMFYLGKEVVDTKPEPPLKTMCRNAWLLHRNYGNPMPFRYRYCREKGVEMFHSMRMNDVHWTPDPDLVQHASLWREHPELQRASFRRGLSGAWSNFALDYCRKEVRDYELAMIREYLSFECDGIELDWLRSVPLCKPGSEELCRPMLTEFVRDIRRSADASARRWGHPVRIMMRVPAYPEECLRLGLDIQKWAKAGYLDVLTPSPTQPGSSEAFLPVELWRQLMPSAVEIAPAIEIGVASGMGPHIKACPATDFAMASNLYHAGADTIYLYNHFYSGSGYLDRQAQRPVYAALGDVEKTNASARRHTVTFYQTSLDAEPLRTNLPWTAWAKSSVCFNVNAGGSTAGRSARVLILSDSDFSADVLLNGEKCEFLPDAVPPQPFPQAPQEKEYHVAQFRIPSGVLHDGGNCVDVVNLREKDFRVLWAEIDVDPA